VLGSARFNQPSGYNIGHHPLFTGTLRAHIARKFDHLHGLYRCQFAFSAKDNVGGNQYLRRTATCKGDGCHRPYEAIGARQVNGSGVFRADGGESRCFLRNRIDLIIAPVRVVRRMLKLRLNAEGRRITAIRTGHLMQNA
jgi:hypothetical protein